VNTVNYQIELLSQHPQKKTFTCGIEVLDRYLQQQASQDMKRYAASTYVMLDIQTQDIIGYYSLAATSIVSADLPEMIAKKLPKYLSLPATLLGRLAVANSYQGKNFGKVLLINALKRSLELSLQIASFAVVVDAKDETATKFYKHHDFLPLNEHARKLFLPMTTIKQIEF